MAVEPRPISLRYNAWVPIFPDRFRRRGQFENDEDIVVSVNIVSYRYNKNVRKLFDELNREPATTIKTMYAYEHNFDAEGVPALCDFVAKNTGLVKLGVKLGVFVDFYAQLAQALTVNKTLKEVHLRLASEAMLPPLIEVFSAVKDKLSCQIFTNFGPLFK